MASLEAALSRLEPAMDAERFLFAHARRPQARAAWFERLIDEVTIKETFLFRQREELDAIAWPALLGRPRATAGSETVRVWVAACATGEEAYTLAILASSCVRLAPSPRCRSPRRTSPRRRSGADGELPWRSLRAWTTRPGPATSRPTAVVAGEPLRRLVGFGRHNLVGDPATGTGQFDLIVCRNVLIYFDGDTVERVIGSLERALAPGGMLILGAADRLSGSTRARQVARRQPARAAGTAPPAGSRALSRPRPRARSRAAGGKRGTSTRRSSSRCSAERRRPRADAHFVRGVAELGLGGRRAAVARCGVHSTWIPCSAWRRSSWAGPRAPRRRPRRRARLRAGDEDAGIRREPPRGDRRPDGLRDVAALCAPAQALREARHEGADRRRLAHPPVLLERELRPSGTNVWWPRTATRPGRCSRARASTS